MEKRISCWIGLVLALASPSFAQDASAPTADSAPTSKDDWQFMFAPYFWAAGLKGDISAGPISTDVDVKFRDILDALDIGALATFEARKDKLSFTTNAIYMKLSDDFHHTVGPGLGPFPPGSLQGDGKVQMLLVEGRAAYDVLSLPLFDDTGERRVAIDVGPGFRTWWLDNHVTAKLKPGIPIGPFETTVDERTSWVDFLIAARLRAQLTEKLGFNVSGDYGGFSIGSSSNYTWSAAGFAGYRLFEHWDLAAGYRVIKIDRDFGDLRLQGPLVGAIYHF